MKKRGSIVCAVLGLALLLFIVPEVNANWEEMEILKYDFDIDVTPRNQWYPWVEYNPIDNEFMVVYRTSGPLRDDCAPGDEYDCLPDLQSIDARRVSPDGVVLGDPLQWSPPEPGHKHAPKIAHNIFANEYMVIFPRGYDSNVMEMNITRTDNLGNILYGPASLYPRQEDAILPVVIFNPARREYLAVYGDRDVFNSWKNNVGFILNEDGSTRTGPFPVGNQLGDMYAPLGAYNPTNDTYLVVWEDFRNVPDWIHPCDIYGALLDADGNMIVEIPIMDDFGMPDEGDARVPNPAYNPDKNEFLVVWEVKKYSLDAPGLMGSGVRGRIINADGTLAGAAFTIIDEPRIQHWPSIVYVQDEQKYFMAWTDTRDDGLPPGDPWYAAPDMDCYATWLDDTGSPVGDEIPISTGDDWQMSGVVSYNPVEKRFLIAWYDRQGGGSDTPFGEAPSAVKGTLYGMPSSAYISIGDQWANCGDVGVKIPICLINLEVEVGAVQIELCENIDDCLICVGCEMTERTTIFDCMVNELDNGCCAVVVFSKNPGGVINPGECDIVIIDYTLRDEPPCCDSCIRIDGENLEIVDQYGYIVDSLVNAEGMVCPFECGDVEPAASTAASWDCGDGDVDIFDILEEVDFIIHVKDPDDCQAVRADVPTGTPPDCDPPDGTIDVGDLMVIIDMALGRQDCCSYYYGGTIY